jgi:hypothetical protein
VILAAKEARNNKLMRANLSFNVNNAKLPINQLHACQSSTTVLHLHNYRLSVVRIVRAVSLRTAVHPSNQV